MSLGVSLHVTSEGVLYEKINLSCKDKGMYELFYFKLWPSRFHFKLLAPVYVTVLYSVQVSGTKHLHSRQGHACI